MQNLIFIPMMYGTIVTCIQQEQTAMLFLKIPTTTKHNNKTQQQTLTKQLQSWAKPSTEASE